MIHIPEHIKTLKPYKPGKPEGGGSSENKVIALCSNENNLGTSPVALEYIKDALHTLNLYPDPTNRALREAISIDLQVSFERIFVRNGSDTIIYALFGSFFKKNDRIITSEGSFSAVDVACHLNQLNLVKTPLTDDYGFDLEKIKQSVNNDTKAIYLCNPNNPTGTYISNNQLESFLEGIPSHVLVIIDEAYFEYAKDGFDDYPDSTRINRSNILTLRTFSKAYGLAGIRLGYAIGQTEIIESLQKIRQPFAPSALAQVAGIGALKDKAYLEKTLRVNKEVLHKYNLLFQELDIIAIPSAANFTATVFDSEEEALQVKNELEESGILVRHLNSFGLPHMLRISTGTMEDYKVFEKAMRSIVVVN